MKEMFFGAAIASFQNEGGMLEDGKSLSSWDKHTLDGTNVSTGEKGDKGVDFYHRYKEDIGYVKDLGMNMLRFSISWSRVLPDGFTLNQKGLDFYIKVVDELLAKGIEPMITLYHWDHPQFLEDIGGWLNHKTIESFKLLADIIGKTFKGKCKYYCTLNEPQNVSYEGYYAGVNAPGLKLSKKDTLQVVHNILLAHGYAYRELKKNDPNCKIGFANCGWVAIPNDPKNEEEDAYNRFFECEPNRIGDGRTIYQDPIVFGDYPKDYYEMYKDFLPEIKPGDMDIIHTGLDYTFCNIYSGFYIRKNEQGVREDYNDKPGVLAYTPGYRFIPEVMYYALKFFYRRYKLPIIITETGANDFKATGIGNDDYRRIYVDSVFLNQIKKAKDEGIPVDGVLFWTLIDNFEWTHGYDSSYGFLSFDKEFNRIKKKSYYWIKEYLSNPEQDIELLCTKHNGRWE